MRTLISILISLSITVPLGGDVTVVVGQKPVVAGGVSVTKDTSVDFHTGSGGILTRTNTITVASQSNRALYVIVGAGLTSGADFVTGVSSDLSGAFTELGQASDGSWVNCQVWRLLNPAVGTHTIIGSFGPPPTQVGMATIALYNVNQSDPEDDAVTANGTGTAPSAASTLAAGDMLIGGLATDGQTGVSVTTGTEDQEEENIDGDTAYSMARNTGTGSTSITWATSNDGFAVVVVAVNASP